MSNNLIPYYLASLFPEPVSTISRYNLQNSSNLQTLKARTSLYYHSFLPTAIRGWKHLSKEVKSCDSINYFKNQLKKLENSPKYYYTGRWKAQILHTPTNQLQCTEHWSFYQKHSRLTALLMLKRWGRQTLLFPLWILYGSLKCPHQCYFSSHSTILKVLYVWGHVTFSPTSAIHLF